jgi:primosomal protein N' (replication factor Y)
MSAAFADVVLPLPVDRPFSYAVPEHLRERIQPGMRAVVPVKNRLETGYVVALHAACAVDSVKPVADLPDAGPVFDAPMLRLCRWMADYYCCTWGEALHGALPAGLRAATRFRYTLAELALAPGRFTDRQRRVIGALYKRGPLTGSQLAKELGDDGLAATLQGMVRRGLLLAEPVFKAGAASIQTETMVRLCAGAIPGNDDLARMQRRAPVQAAVLLDLLHGGAERAATDLYTRHGATSATLRALERQGCIERFEREFYRSPGLQADAKSASKHPLNAEQQAAWDEIAAALDARQFQTFLLQGITGSGKTEVYLQAIEHALAQGRDAIILVPEISLTPQTVGRFYARFDQHIAVLHSGLGTGERYDEWRRAQRGEVRIVVGARSAVFAPLPRLGMIIVDEEHDSSYKQGENPRYHARDVAIMRAKLAGAVCVLGSATPSVESAQNAATGKSRRLSLRARATSGTLPEVRLIDMRHEVRETGGKIVLARALEEAVQQRLAEREQVILLLNRRGFAPYVLCPMCGWVANCEDCQVSLTYHRSGEALRCHYCDHRRPVPATCDACNFNPLIFVGTGTQRAEDYLERAFPQARVARMDADTTAGKGGHAKILGRFAAGEIDLLIGTQMLAKGHDYPGVTLVGVINADTGLALPDFRAAEQTFPLLTQVAGRAGRGDRPGVVYVQTCRPKHYAIQAAAKHDYDAFFRQEIAHREASGYPPFRRMANFLLEGPDPLAAEREAVRLRRLTLEAIEALGFHGMEVLGPSPAAIQRVQKKYRWNLGLLSKSHTRLNTLVRRTRDQFNSLQPRPAVDLKVDLDPYGAF